MPKITIPLTQTDCEDIINGETFDWTFDTDDNQTIDVHIKLEDDTDLE